MNLKTAIYIVETSYGLLGILALFGIGASFFVFKNEYIIIAIIFFISLLIAAYFIKLNLIRMYLKNCKYPFEFLSVLEQLELTDDIEVEWSENPTSALKKNLLETKQFLEDNNLVTDIGAKELGLPFFLITTGSMIVGLILFAKKFSDKENYIILISFLLAVFIVIYYLRSKKRKNDNNPVLLFQEKGLSLYGTLYPWSKIKSWKYKSGSKYSDGEMIIIFENLNFECVEVKSNLNQVNIDRIDFMLLLTHFKAKFG